MPQAAKNQSPKQFVIAQLKQVGRDEYTPEAVEGCLNVIRPVIKTVYRGELIYIQVKKLVQAKNGKMAIKLLDTVHFRPKFLMPMVVMLAVVITLAGTALVFVLVQGG